jgi:septal ring factor EnvC (AmiA/AmiB activator)
MSEDTTQQLPHDALRQILARFDSLDARLTALEEKVDRRLQETRPIWEQVLVRLTAIEERLTSVETRLGRVEEEVYGLNRKVRIFSIDIVKLQDKDDDLEERLKQMEAERTR